MIKIISGSAYNSDEFPKKNKMLEDIKQYDSFMQNVYTLNMVTCSCCGKVMPIPNDSVLFNNGESDDFYTFRPNNGNGVTYDPRNLPEEDRIGAFFTPVIFDEEDQEGYEWRDFCKPCWERLKHKSDEYLYNKYPAAEFE